MKAESGEVEEREEKLSSLSLIFFRFLPHRAAAERASEGASERRPCWVERGSSLSFKSHSLWRFPLRISQRDQRRRGSDRGEGGKKNSERRREREERWVADVWKRGGKRKRRDSGQRS